MAEDTEQRQSEGNLIKKKLSSSDFKELGKCFGSWIATLVATGALATGIVCGGYHLAKGYNSPEGKAYLQAMPRIFVPF